MFVRAVLTCGQFAKPNPQCLFVRALAAAFEPSLNLTDR
jgi:hypothetical protein